MRDLAGQRWGAADGRRVLAAWRQSGLSLNAFAQEHGFVAQRLGWWKKKIGDGSAVEIARFVPVVVRGAERATPGAVVVLRSRAGVTVEVNDPGIVPVEWLIAVMNGLS